jgi:RNA polymerase sigma-70 factor (ECF subfamily)
MVSSSAASMRLAARRQRVRSAEVRQPVEPVGGDLSDVVDDVVFEQRLVFLGDAERTLIRLRYEEELSNPEIARRLALPEGTVKVRLHRLRHRLREAIKDEEEGSSR